MERHKTTIITCNGTTMGQFPRLTPVRPDSWSPGAGTHNRHIYSELGLLWEEVPTTIYGDNNGLVAMANNPQFHSRSKHIVVRCHWVRELVQENTISVNTCGDLDQTTDILTKALPRQKHAKHVAAMGLTSA